MTISNLLGVSPIGFVAGGAITKDTPVKLHTTEGQVVAAGAATDECIGFALNTVASGEPVSIQAYGVARAVASAAINLGAKVMWATGGKVVTASGATSKVLGIALKAPTADAQVFPILLFPMPSFVALGS